LVLAIVLLSIIPVYLVRRRNKSLVV